MDTSRVTSEIVDLLSRITGQKLSQRDITPQVLFLASLVTVLLGVMLVDGTVSEAEKQHLQKILSRFSQSNSDVQKLTNLMIKGVKENQIYKKIQDLLKLTSPLSESEKILLIGFGYEMSAADGNIDIKEKQYLGIVAKNLGIKSEYLEVFEIAFTHQGKFDASALNEVHFLLDPSRFQELDTVFVKAASDMLAILPAKREIKTTQKHTSVSYDKLKKFQVYRQQLDKYCYQVFQIIQECQNHNLLPNTLINEMSTVSKKIQSQRFRLAVVGEFSQGKSTLLNALLGEEIQPVRAIPCSGAVTVLKYGTQKRVICRYKDGRSEEIAFEEYKVKATISKEAALEHRSDELAQSNIEEIIFEHPELALCKNGVEIVDSPGLNEHPQRTAITQKILTDTDAAIFLTNAMRLLPEKEKELLHDVRYQLNNSSKKEPADNLFVLVNFMDNLDTQEDVQDVKQRLESFVKKENLLVFKEINRVHYISAKTALKSIQNGNNDEYLQSFQMFTQSLEKFLTLERGTLKINRAVNDITQVITKCLDSLDIVEESLDGKIKLSATGKQEILEKIGEASGCDVRIRILVDHLIESVMEQANISWNEWVEHLEVRLILKSTEWTSKHSGIWSRDKLAQDYANQFNKDISQELESWINDELKENILKEPLERLDNAVEKEFEKIQSEFHTLNYFSQNQSTNWKFLDDKNSNLSVINNSSFWGAFGAIGIGAALVPVVFFAGPILVALLGGAGAGLLGGGGIAILENSITENVLKLGCEQFVNSVDGIFERIDKMIYSLFNERIKRVNEVVEETISIYENVLEQQEKAHQENLEQRETEKAFINQKRQELEQVQKELQTMINKS
ncbi:dynamin family protein [Sphaerospermopsis sp. LEGE 08334]|uniref:dynamin family protein n=1 Tax=Sphaerospermopsis sp. LEGE 08334 TaxID=1828651 RepID=UPI00187F021B|nr:dynamin family protein [Sphaerospermopsis sp. LEGE 08334]MBE9058357.1 dynamin family protein [Sphaerospermopsis sp. LEGE 08334]